MPHLPILTLRRSGRFRLRVRGDAHCGVTSTGELQCGYALVVSASAAGLDAQGFLVEQVSVDRFFQELGETTLSCELLVIECARDLWRKIRNENPRAEIFGIRLTISPQTPAGATGEASMTFSWGEIS